MVTQAPLFSTYTFFNTCLLSLSPTFTLYFTVCLLKNQQCNKDSNVSITSLDKKCIELAEYLGKAIDLHTLNVKIVSFLNLHKEVQFSSCFEILKFIKNSNLVECYSNLFVALRIILTIPVFVAGGERSFSKLKLIKTYLRSTMSLFSMVLP